MSNIILNINNKIEKNYPSGKYVGQIVNGLREAKGIFYYNNWDKHEGDWKNDKYEGKGIYYMNDGDIYEGDWKNYKKEEKGIY